MEKARVWFEEITGTAEGILLSYWFFLTFVDVAKFLTFVDVGKLKCIGEAMYQNVVAKGMLSQM